MRTTITIDEQLYRRVKAEAAAQGRTIGAVIEDALRAREARAEPKQFAELPVFEGDGLLPGVDMSSNAALRETMDGQASADALR